MDGEAFLIGMLVSLFLLAKLLGWLVERIGLPSFVGEILAGAIVINFTIGSFNLAEYFGIDPYTTASQSGLNFSALTIFFYLGLVFLVFTVGLKIRPSALRSVARSSLEIALVGVVVPFAIGAAFVLLAIGDANLYAVLFIGTALAASSLGVVSRLLSDDDLVDRPEGRRLLGAAVFEDIVAFVLLAIILAFASKGSATNVEFAQQVLLVVGIAIAFVVVFLFLAEPVAERLAPAGAPGAPPDPKTRAGALGAALLVVLGAAFIAANFQLAAVLGAFFAGMAMASIAPRFDLERSFDALNALFVPFFFVFIGLFVGVPGLLAVWPLIVLITVLAVVGKLAAGAVHARSLGRDEALTVGTALVARGEVALIIAIAAANADLLSDDYLSALVVMSIATTIIGPILYRRVRASRGGSAPAAVGPPPG